MNYIDGELNFTLHDSDVTGGGGEDLEVMSSDPTFVKNQLISPTTGIEFEYRSVVKNIIERDGEVDGEVLIGLLTDRTGETDDDYLVGGVWLQTSRTGPNGSPKIESSIGAFIDGPDGRTTPAQYIETDATATYEGDAAGTFISEVLSGDNTVGLFIADVELNATFGPTTPYISGQVSNFRTGNDINNLDAALMELPNTMLNLNQAPINTTESVGFFDGTTAGTQGTVIPGVDYSYSGKWGGQLYGDEADYLGGTFSGYTDNPTFKAGFVGIFSAKKPSPPESSN